MGREIVDVGRWWQDSPPTEIDAIALAGRNREAVLLSEAKWSRRIDGRALRTELEAKAGALPKPAPDPTYAVAARETVDRSEGLLAITAADVFGGSDSLPQ